MPDVISAPETARPDISTPNPLSGPQQAALTAMFSGKAIREAASVARVHRTTVSRWLHRDPHFRAAYNAWRQELLDSSRSRLLRTAELATGIVHRAIAKGDGRLALALLKSLGLADVASAAAGPSDPKLALDEIAIESDEHRDALNRRLNAICHADIFQSHKAPSHLKSLREEAEKGY